MKYIIILLASIIGAFDIWQAVNNFNDGHYFIFGLNIMFAIWMASILVKASVTL